MTNSMLLLDAVEGHALARPNDVAVLDAGQPVCWSAFWDDVCVKSGQLLQADIRPGDSVAIMARSSAAYLAAIMACAKVGAVCAPLSTLLNTQTQAVLLRDSGARAIWLDDALHARDDRFEGVTGPLAALALKGTDADTAASVLNVAIDSNAPMSLIYSSGTTGTPKGILHSRSARDQYGAIFAIEYGITQASVTLLATPLYSNGTWMMALPTLFAGGCCVIVPDLKTDMLAEALVDYDITHAFLVPTQLDGLFSKGARALGGASITLVSAGSFLPLNTKRSILDSPDISLFELYGNTEGVCSILRPSQMEAGFNSVGTAIITGQISTRENGEIIGRNALQSMGYHNRPELNEALWHKESNGKVYVCSGDLGEMDDEGYLHLKGRLKDMIVSGGINIYPADLEEVIRSLDGVADAAVVGMAHKKWGETPVAFVVAEPDSAVNAHALKALINTQLNKYQRVDQVFVCSDFPRNALGKVLKNELANSLLEENRIDG